MEKDGEDNSKFRYKLNVAKTLLKPRKLTDVFILAESIARITAVLKCDRLGFLLAKALLSAACFFLQQATFGSTHQSLLFVSWP